jgi:Rrf2 family protein
VFTHRAKYAIKALIHLARRAGQGPVHAHSIAADEQIPQRFLELILIQLRNGGLVLSRAGRGGGHQLMGSPENISLLTVIHALDEPIDPLPCLSSTAYVRCRDCDDESACTTRHLFIKIQEEQSALLSHATLASVMPKPRISKISTSSPIFPVRPAISRTSSDLPIINTTSQSRAHHIN